MAIGADGIRIGPVTAAEQVAPLTPAGDVRQEVFHRSLQQMLGQQLQGNVLSRMADGSFMVKVEGLAARMQLPEGTKAGDTLPMTLTALNPRPTFSLGQEHGSAAALIVHVNDELTYVKPAPPIARNIAVSGPGPATALVYLEPGAASPFSSETGNKAALTSAGQLLDVTVDDESLIYGPRAAVGGTGSAAALAGTTAPAAVLSKNALAANAALNQALSESSSAQASLSNAGKLINQVLQATAEMPHVIVGSTPIVGSPTVVPQQLAAALHSALDLSGVFYESHLRQWLDGKRDLSQLAREPQAQAQNALAGERAALANAASLSVSAEMAASASRQAGVEEAGLAFPHLVNLQLNALEQHAVQWSGQIWPGQQMEWEVQLEQAQKDAGGRGGDNQEQSRIWHSAMRFHFPLLGKIGATIHLVGNVVQVELSTPDAATASTLRDASGQLASALDAAGSPLQSFAVKLDEPT